MSGLRVPCTGLQKQCKADVFLRVIDPKVACRRVDRSSALPTLNGMRGMHGMAAAVVIFHAVPLFGAQIAPCGYLTVDQFLVLPGAASGMRDLPAFTIVIFPARPLFGGQDSPIGCYAAKRFFVPNDRAVISLPCGAVIGMWLFTFLASNFRAKR